MYGTYIWAVYLAHSLFMANWLGVIQTDTFQSSYDSHKEAVFSRVILPFVYIFIFFNIKQDRTRLSTCVSFIFFYAVVALENTILVVLWKNTAGDQPHWFARAAVFAQAIFLITSIALQGIYYAYFEIETKTTTTPDDADQHDQHLY